MSERKLTQLGVGDWIALATLLHLTIFGGIVNLHVRLASLETSVDFVKSMLFQRSANSWPSESGNGVRDEGRGTRDEQRADRLPAHPLAPRPSPLGPQETSAGSGVRLRAPSFLTRPRVDTDTAGKSIREPSSLDTRSACGVARPVAQPPPNARITSCQ